MLSSQRWHAVCGAPTGDLYSAVDMWRTHTVPGEFADELRRMLNTMLSTHTTLLRDGFIRGDAEP